MLYTKWLLIILGFILGLSLMQFILSIHPPRFSDGMTPDKLGLDYENVSFTTSDKIRIAAWLISSPKPKGTVIVGHGYPFDKANIFPVARFLYPDYNLLFYDHRYFGESSGWITTGGVKEPEDVKAAVRFVRKRFKDKPIALYGFSLSASSMLMANQKVNAIISDSAYASLDNMVARLFAMFGPVKAPFVFATKFYASLFLRVQTKDVSPAKAVEKSKIPILVIHGDQDSQIPVENAYALKDSNPSIELWIVKGSDHGEAYARHPKIYKKRVKDFLKKHMK